jgi:Ca2+:H+ antiporter
MGLATEGLTAHLGSLWGSLLNATFGNATELIIGLFGLHAGLVALVRASIVGSIIGNILLVLGGSILVGGLKYRTQTFNQELAQARTINLLLAALSLAIPAIFWSSFHHTNGLEDPAVKHLSVWMAAILLLLYAASLTFALRNREDFPMDCEDVTAPAETPAWPKRMSLIVLASATAVLAVESEMLVGSVTGAARSLGVNQVFIGIVIVAIIGNAAEHSTAIWMSLKNKMDVTVGITIGSSIQIAMFVAPVLIFASIWMRHQLTFIFSVPEISAIGFSVIIATFIAGDGKSNWLEGAQLLAAYAIIALAFYFLPP